MKRLIQFGLLIVVAIVMTACPASAKPIRITAQMTGTNVNYALNDMPLPLHEIEKRMEKLSHLDTKGLVLLLAQPEVPIGALQKVVSNLWRMKLLNVHCLILKEGEDGLEIIFKGMEPLRPEDLGPHPLP